MIQFVINLSSLVRWVLLSCKSMVLELVPYLTHTVAKMNIDGNYWWIDVRLQLIIKIIITVSPVTNWTIWVWQVEHITESIIAIEGDSLASLLRNKETWKQEKKKTSITSALMTVAMSSSWYNEPLTLSASISADSSVISRASNCFYPINALFGDLRFYLQTQKRANPQNPGSYKETLSPLGILIGYNGSYNCMSLTKWAKSL